MVIETVAAGKGRAMSNLKAIEHWGFHFGREARKVDAGAGLVPDYPLPGDWFCLRERFGEGLETDEKFAFVQGYRSGTSGVDCPFCSHSEPDSVEAHARFMDLVIQ